MSKERAQVVRIYDGEELVPTRLYEHAAFPFPDFNPVQSGLFQIYDRDANVTIAASTSAGKTVCAEMYLSHEVRVRGGKGMYISPLKALAQEKIDDWTDPRHHFHDLKLSICTGDYALSESRKKELNHSDLILMTSEMLASRCRNITSEKSSFLREVGTLVIDESHLLTVPGRGDHLEVALMKLTEINPKVRIVLLSATMANVDQICGWVAQKLTNKTCYLLESKYRPCPLQIHYEVYEKAKGATYEDTEREKIWAAEQIIDDHPEDKFLVFAHTKRTGEMAKKRFLEKGIQCEFHNADLPKDKRVELEKRFKTDKNFRVIVATSTLAWGLNLPARRVIILGVHRGMNLVANYDIFQMIGRAGRLGLDPAGDAYILLPNVKKDFIACKYHIQKPCYIESQLLSYVGREETEELEGVKHYKTLAFHVISEIHRGNVKTRQDIFKWYSRSMADFQAQDIDHEIIGNVVELLVKCGAVREQDGQLEATSVGTIASMLYYSPFDVADFKRNFSRLFTKNLEGNDYALSIALGNIDSYKFGIVSNAERDELYSYDRKLQELYGPQMFTEPAVKAGFCYFNLLRGRGNATLNGMMRGLQFDFDRTAQVLMMLDQMGAKWGRKEWLRTLKTRVKHGVPWHLVSLCGLPEVKAVRSQKLFDAGLRTLKDVADNPERVASVLRFKGDRLQAVLDYARSHGKDRPSKKP